MDEATGSEPVTPSVWGIAGNMIEERLYGPGGAEVRYGTRLFRAGAKVYLGTLDNAGAIVDPEDDYENILVVGQHRNSRDWIMAWTHNKRVTNWRVQLVYQPGAIARLLRAEWPGFLLEKGEFTCPESERNSEKAIRELLEAVTAKAFRTRKRGRSAVSAAFEIKVGEE